MLFMIKKMLTRGTVLVASMIAANAVIEQLEKAQLKRKEEKSKKVIDLREKDEEITEEDVELAMSLQQ